MPVLDAHEPCSSSHIASISTAGPSATVGHMTYIFRGSVGVGQDSQAFRFDVAPYLPMPSQGPYLVVTMTYASLGPGVCDLDVSLWDAEGDRTGGLTAHSDSQESAIPNSNYLPSETSPEIVVVSQVHPFSAGVWATAVHCRDSSSFGGTFEIRVDILLVETLHSGQHGTMQSFLVPSNAYRLAASLAKSSGSEIDLSMVDGYGRRTGGASDSSGLYASWIPNSIYIGSALGQDTVSVLGVMATDGEEAFGERWGVQAYCVSGRDASYGMAVQLEVDSDLDGVPDALDVDPVRDLCVRLTITDMVQKDPIDGGENPWDPFVRLVVGDAVPGTDAVGGPGDAWGSRLWSRSSRPMRLNGDFHGNYTLWKNVPDDSRYVPLMIQVWDDDAGGRADLCDISPRKGGGDEFHQDGSTLHLIYDLLFQSWSGDVTTGFASGEMDGSANRDEDDVEIRFSLSTASELPFTQQVYIANRFSPVLFLDGAEDSGPLEVFAMLNQSQLRDVKTREPVREPPLAEHDLSEFREGTYLDLWDRQVQFYQSRIYCHVFTSDMDTLVLQYWFFYLYDSLSPHEGDWEMIQLAFAEGSRYGDASSLEPVHAAYSQHYRGDLKAWSDPDVQKEDGHPLVFVSLGGHASFFSGQQSVRCQPPVALMGPSDWLSYEGKWGSSKWSLGTGGESVPGPVYRASMATGFFGRPLRPIAYIWHEPLYWMYRL